ncbi:unnamed protein product [Chondrus crispus]|uniref:Uncharacterized protein n=1 Tax=Chondrus crispus TaxID=2769 RepID=R7QLB0_CHOCR|nr:unnamed protein product [Chondrus crispus]CDF38266.1 unnamed protein product [Chondrus crispus]|eukprot:XP_005718151.1 unnamed protein product [Chondrus crispus]
MKCYSTHRTALCFERLLPVTRQHTLSQPKLHSYPNHAFLSARVVPRSKHSVFQLLRIRLNAHPTGEARTVHLHHRLLATNRIAIRAHSHRVPVEQDHVTTCGTTVVLIA